MDKAQIKSINFRATALENYLVAQKVGLKRVRFMSAIGSRFEEA